MGLCDSHYVDYIVACSRGHKIYKGWQKRNERNIVITLVRYLKTDTSYHPFVLSLQLVDTNPVQRNGMENQRSQGNSEEIVEEVRYVANCSVLNPFPKGTDSGSLGSLWTRHQLVLWPRLLTARANPESEVISFRTVSSEGNKCLVTITEIALAETAEF